MNEQMKELTLLLLYLSSWEEKEFNDSIRRSWKGYLFEVLNELEEEKMIFGSNRAKSVYFTDAGEAEAKKLIEKYIG